MDRVTRHPLMEDLPFETVVDYAAEFMQIVGTPKSFIEKTCTINVNDYRGELPCDYYEMIQVRSMDGGGHTSYVYSTDTFHMSTNPDGKRGHTYKIQGSCIITSVPKCTLELSYRAMPIDKDGYPLIPDNSTYGKALELYIKLQYFTVLFDTGKIHGQVLNNTQQQYAWAVGQAQTDLIRPSIDQMEAISNMWNKLLPDRDVNHHSNFVNEGLKEHIRTH